MGGKFEIINFIGEPNPGKRIDLITWGKEGEGIFTTRLNKGGSTIDTSNPRFELAAKELGLTSLQLLERLENMTTGDILTWD